MSEAVKEYGRALADLAAEEALEDALLAECRAVRGIFLENPAYVRLLQNPEISKEERCTLIGEAFSGQVHPYLVNFLKMLTERGYAGQTTAFLAEYERLYRERHNIATAAVTSAAPLSAEQKTRLCRKLESITGQTIELECTVDPSLLGGVRLILNNTLYEGSIRAKLDELRASLTALTL